MATIRHTLQKEVFQVNNERLICVCHVEKLYKKKKASFLCVVQNLSSVRDISIVQIKQTEKGFKRKNTWGLSQLKAVDGKSVDIDNQELDLHLEKIYRWCTSNPHERRQFITELWRQSSKHLPKQRTDFRNIPDVITADVISTPEIKFNPTSLDVTTEVDLNDDYQAITEREETDLNKLMSGCEFAISNAEAFMDIITRDLSLLDGENVQCVLASETQIEVLMEQMEAAIQEAEKIETRLDDYDRILCHVRDTMETMKKKNTMIEVANKNNQTLLVELVNVVQQLDLSHVHQATLVDTELTTPQGLAAAIEAGNALKSCMNCELHPALLRLAAVQEQRKRFDKLRDKFSHSISRQLNNLFIHLGNDKSDFPIDELTLPNHNNIHKELSAFSELMHWTKAMDREAYQKLRKIYTDSIGKLYERDLKVFFEQALQRVLTGASRGSGGSEEAMKSGGKNANKKEGATGALLGIDRDQWPNDTNSVDRLRYDSTLERVLAQLEPVCLNEQKFCVSFFQLDVISPTGRNTQTTLDVSVTEPDVIVIDALPNKKIARQVNEEVRKTMGELFTSLEEELLSFISQLERQDSFYCMYVLVRLSQHVMSAQDTGSFLSMTFASALVQVKRSFDRFMQSQMDSIKDSKVPRRSKCGILPYVHNFEEFATCTEAVFKGERRADLDKWHTRLVDTILESIVAHSVQHHKTPSDVIKMENYHHLYALLSQLKIPVLDGQRKDTKQRYTEALAAYVTKYFGRPLEKLNQFFEGVQARVASGVKISEVSYQLAFSKQELRKVIQQYPKREVKHGLENLYRKVEKHLSEEENLLQVVWRAMQEEFIRQYKHLEELIQRCYPGSMITLDFSIDNILEFFSEIAQSH